MRPKKNSCVFGESYLKGGVMKVIFSHTRIFAEFNDAYHHHPADSISRLEWNPYETIGIMAEATK